MWNGCCVNGIKLIISSKKENSFLNGSLVIKLKIDTSILTVLISIFLFFFTIFIIRILGSSDMIRSLQRKLILKSHDWKRFRQV